MSVYNVSGTEINTVYNSQGQVLSNCYDINGNELLDGGADYDHYDNEYQHTILQARDEWKVKYRADDTVIPIIFHTDQHRYLRYVHDLFTYLSLAIKWSEVSAIANLGDTCGSTYTVNELDDMLSCLSPISATKKIGVWGNHDCQLHVDEGSGYAYKALIDAQFTVLKDNYFDNSGYGDGTYHVYDNRNNEYVVDKDHNIKYVIISTWYFNSEGQVYYDPRLSYDAAEAWITMLSAVDNYDIVLLSHIEPYYYANWYYPAVDGGTGGYGSHTMDHISKVTPMTQINQLIADRKTKSSGSIVDYDGVTHNYNFSNCTSDILCCFAGHEHADYYQFDANGTVPVIIFDAMGYDYHPFYMVNIDRTNHLVDVWKVDDSPTYYNFQVPFTAPT